MAAGNVPMVELVGWLKVTNSATSNVHLVAKPQEISFQSYMSDIPTSHLLGFSQDGCK